MTDPQSSFQERPKLKSMRLINTAASNPRKGKSRQTDWKLRVLEQRRKEEGASDVMRGCFLLLPEESFAGVFPRSHCG